jgi:hypothetical protein
VREALAYLHPDGYDFWIRMGMAIHHSSGGTDEGFGLWHDWSSRGDTYDGLEDCRYHWRSFGDYDGRALGLGSLYSAAKCKGFDPAPPPPETPPLTAYAGDREAGGPTVQRRALRITWAREYGSVNPARFVVGHLIECGSLVCIYGESNTGKSTFAIDVGLTCTQGVPWRGRRTRPCVVVYLPLEGARGVRDRVHARMLRDELPDDLPFLDLTGSVDLLNPAMVEDLIAIIRSVVREGFEILLIVDTVHRAMPGGDENSGQDMGALVAACDVIRTQTAATVILVHHAGKDTTRGARGHSSLRAAVDTEIEITGTQNPRVAKVTKQRDLPSGDVFPFNLEAVEIGTDPETFQTIRACIVVPLDTVPSTTRRDPTGRNQQLLLGGIREHVRANDSPIIASLDLRKIAKAQGLKDRRRFTEARDSLERDGWITPSVGGHRYAGDVL